MWVIEFERCEFQVVPPCGGHLPPAEPPPYQCRFQVVPPCGGHPGQHGLATDNVLVSSRAPGWGASQCVGRCSAFFSVSSRAPVWGASTASKVRVFVAVSFKSCPRVGGISTNLTEFRLHRCFKSCPRVGGIPCGSSFSFIVMFQVVPPCGGHLAQWPRRFGLRCFKSCPRVGGIKHWSITLDNFELFQVVPPCGGHPVRMIG